LAVLIPPLHPFTHIFRRLIGLFAALKDERFQRMFAIVCFRIQIFPLAASTIRNRTIILGIDKLDHIFIGQNLAGVLNGLFNGNCPKPLSVRSGISAFSFLTLHTRRAYGHAFPASILEPDELGLIKAQQNRVFEQRFLFFRGGSDELPKISYRATDAIRLRGF
jgi:hypothetical protein